MLNQPRRPRCDRSLCLASESELGEHSGRTCPYPPNLRRPAAAHPSLPWPTPDRLSHLDSCLRSDKYDRRTLSYNANVGVRYRKS
jgi:hypothetical protein